jgi:hypothetical protein
MTNIDELVDLVTPPMCPIAAPPWDRSRSVVGFDFPTDYRSFFDKFGSGSFRTEGRTISFGIQGPYVGPDSPTGLAGFPGFVDVTVSDVRPAFTSDDGTPAEWSRIPYRFLPDPGGLLQWGTTDSGDSFFWLTEATNSDDWPVVIWERHDSQTHLFEGGFLAFLLAAIRQQNPSFHWLLGPHPTWALESDWLNIY